MRTHCNAKTACALLSLAAITANSQGTFIYDQQSATNASATYGAPLQQGQPLGQSFTPTLPAIDFVQLLFLNAPPVRTNATIVVNLWSGSIGGTLLGSTTPVFFPASFTSGLTNFYFPTSVALIPGMTYYLQPLIQSGGNNAWSVQADFYNYAGGTYIFQGAPNPDGLDLWFREGTFTPEPSPQALIAVGVIALRVFARRQQRNPNENASQC